MASRKRPRSDAVQNWIEQHKVARVQERDQSPPPHDDDSSEYERPPVPHELIALAGELMALGASESMECASTLLKAEELCEAFWVQWWSK